MLVYTIKRFGLALLVLEDFFGLEEGDSSEGFRFTGFVDGPLLEGWMAVLGRCCVLGGRTGLLEGGLFLEGARFLNGRRRSRGFGGACLWEEASVRRLVL